MHGGLATLALLARAILHLWPAEGVELSIPSFQLEDARHFPALLSFPAVIFCSLLQIQVHRYWAEVFSNSIFLSPLRNRVQNGLPSLLPLCEDV